MADAQTATAVAHHRVHLVQLFSAFLEHLDRDPHLLGHFLDLRGVGRQELVQRRVEQTDRHGQPVHGLEDANEVLALHRQQSLQRLGPLVHGLGEDHLPHGGQAVLAEEHVLRAAEADTLGSEGARHGRVLGRVRVGAHTDRAVVVGPFLQLGETLIELGLARLELLAHQHAVNLGGVGIHPALDDLARGTVDGQHVALLERLPAHAKLTLVLVHVQGLGAHDARLAHTARHHRGV